MSITQQPSSQSHSGFYVLRRLGRSAACRRTRLACVEKICAPIWKISSLLAVQCVEARKLEWQIKESRITLGRATITTAPEMSQVLLITHLLESALIFSTLIIFYG